MKILRASSKRYCSRWLGGVLVLWLLFSTVWKEEAQSSPAPAESLTLSIEPLCKGKRLEDEAIVPAPADIYILVGLGTTAKMHAGDTVKIDFFADGKKLCSDKAIWHDAIRPSNRPGMASPMIVALAQFGVPSCEWTNAPPGKHTLTAKAYGFHKLTATAEPVRITILPPPAAP